MEQNKEGTKCIITCAKNVDFRKVTLSYVLRKSYKDPKKCPACNMTLPVDTSTVETVNLLMPPLSWKKRKNLV